MKKLVAFFTERSLIVNMISIFVLIAGGIFLFSANREGLPKVSYNWVTVVTIYPGSTASDIEKHITIPLEDEIREVDGLEEIYSGSNESLSTIAIKLDPDVENKNQVINDIKDAVDMVTDLPEDAETPVVKELSTFLVPVLEISIINKKGIHTDEDERQLRRHAKLLEDELRELSGTAKVDKKGYRDREMIVEVNPELLDVYHIGLNEISSSLTAKNLNFPGGIIKAPDEDILVRTIGEVETVDEIRNVLIRSNDLGNWVRIGDVAKVSDSFEEETIINKTNGRKSITLTLLKKESADIITLVDEANVVLDRFKKTYGDRYEISTSNDMSYFVKRRLNVLVNNGKVGFVLVLLTLFVALGWRISLVTALGIPLAFGGTFIWMAANNVTVNLMSMFGLIIVLGMLVDDAIVVAENVYSHLEEGKPVKDAVIDGTSEVILPVAGTIMTTIAAFAPLLFMSGIMGSFIWTMPAVVCVALAVSWLEAMFILPSHIYDIEKRRKKPMKKHLQKKDGLYNKIKNLYAAAIRFVLGHKYKFALLITVVFFGSVYFAVGHMKFVLFPQGKVERIVVKAEAVNGTGVADMSEKLGKIERIIAALPKVELDNYISKAGIIEEQPLDPDTKNGSNYGTIIINLTAEETRERVASEIVDELREKTRPLLKDFVKVEFSLVKMGAPVGEPVNVTVMGDDFSTIKKAADEYREYLKSIRGLKDVKDDFEQGKKELRIYIKDRLASMAGISVFDIASTVRTCFKGNVATTIKKTDEEIDIRVIFPERIRNRVDGLDHIKVANRMGNLIPLSQVADYKYTRGLSVINRRAWKRAIKVTADIDEKSKDVSSVAVNSMLQKKFSDISVRYPGITVDYLGEFKDTQESVVDLLKSFIIAFMIIFVILVALFRSLIHPLVIIGVIPLTFVGVVWAFAAHGEPLSFFVILGVVGLAGVVVNDSIVLVDFIRKERRLGLSPFEASIEAGRNRLRPVFLTTVTTFFGLIPTAYGIGGYDPFVMPMAISMASGLAFGSFITLFATPIAYKILSGLRRKVFRSPVSPDLIEREPFSKTVKEIEDEITGDIENRIVKDVRVQFDEDLMSYGEVIRREVELEIMKKVKELVDSKPGKKKEPKSAPKKAGGKGRREK